MRTRLTLRSTTERSTLAKQSRAALAGGGAGQLS
jgi:hypothetical protein